MHHGDINFFAYWLDIYDAGLLCSITWLCNLIGVQGISRHYEMFKTRRFVTQCLTDLMELILKHLDIMLSKIKKIVEIKWGLLRDWELIKQNLKPNLTGNSKRLMINKVMSQ